MAVLFYRKNETERVREVPNSDAPRTNCQRRLAADTEQGSYDSQCTGHALAARPAGHALAGGFAALAFVAAAPQPVSRPHSRLRHSKMTKRLFLMEIPSFFCFHL